jgi:hypothetical protein
MEIQGQERRLKWYEEQPRQSKLSMKAKQLNEKNNNIFKQSYFGRRIKNG